MITEKLNIEDKLIRARIQIQRRNPFFAYLSLYLKFKEVKAKELDGNGCGVDALGNFYYTTEFIDKLTDEELMGVVVHEILHLSFLHLLREGPRDHMGWNIACDIVVNEMLLNNNFRLPADGIIPENHCFEIGTTKLTKLNEKLAEQVYDELPKQMKQKQKGFDLHIVGSGLGKDNKPMSEEEKRQLTKDWLGKTEEAFVNSKMRGNVPVGMELLLGKLHENKVNWRSLLNRYITSYIPYDFTYAKPNKKSICSGFYMPDYFKEKIKVVVAVDTSGSIGQKELADFLSEIVGMARGLKDRLEMVLITHDTQIQNNLTIENGNISKILELQIKGGGGTSHEDVLNEIKKIRDCKVAVFLTDGYSDLDNIKLNDYNFKKIFVISEGGSDEQIKDNKEVSIIKI